MLLHHQARGSRRHLFIERLERRELLTALRMVNWNTLDGPNNQTQIDLFTTILSAIGSQNVAGAARPIDLLAIQETSPQRASNIEAILDGLYADDYESITIGGSSPDEYVGFVYNTASLELLGASSVSGSFTHQPLRGEFRPVGSFGDSDFYAYSIHLKAGNAGSDQSTRAIETAALRNNANNLGDGQQVIFMGDFNMRSSNETAFGSFLSPGNAQLQDPINRLGNWYNNQSFRDIHTQNPQNNATGGFMDDRFDLQLLSGEFFDGFGIDYISGSYRAFGNNGTHSLNGPITTGSGASPSVLSALALASDHLPVVADYEFTTGIALTVDDIVVDEAAGTAAFTINADSAPESDITVQYATQDGSAVSEADFGSAIGTATISALTTSTTVVVNIVNDTEEESDEIFYLNLFNASIGATIADSLATATITANDVASVGFGFSQETITIPQGTVEFTLQLLLTGTAPTFDAFTYALGIGDGFGGGGSGIPPQFMSVPTLINAVSSWSNFGSLPTPQAATGNVNAPPGMGESASLPSSVLSFTIDTSQSVAGDSWTLDANLVNASEASFQGNPFPTIAANTTINVIPAGQVVDRHLFYNSSFYDGDQAAAGAADDDAIDQSKQPLLAGSTATLQNYSGFDEGINGIMIDIQGLPTDPVPADFAFAIGNDSEPANWLELAVEPVIAVRPGAGTNRSDRVTLIWPDDTIANTWLEVKVLSDGPGAIVVTTDTFYFGSAVGEVGAGDTRVNSTDAGSVSANFTPIFPPQTESPSEAHDVNKDGKVNSTDYGFVSSNFTPIFPPGQELVLISPPGPGSPVSFLAVSFVEPSSAARELEPIPSEAVDLAMAVALTAKVTSFGENRRFKPIDSAIAVIDRVFEEQFELKPFPALGESELI